MSVHGANCTICVAYAHSVNVANSRLVPSAQSLLMVFLSDLHDVFDSHLDNFVISCKIQPLSSCMRQLS